MNLNRLSALVALMALSSAPAIAAEAPARRDAPQYRQEASGDPSFGRLEAEAPRAAAIVSEDARRSTERCCNVPNDPVAY